MSKYIYSLLFLVVISASAELKGQTFQYKYSYSFSISGNNTAADQKINIDFLRTHFNTTKCIYNTSNSTYSLFLNHLINTGVLKKKLIAKGILVSNEIQLNHLDVIDNQSEPNNN